ncbi:MAG: hypothetical protein ACD_21C00246G0005 [uncultured bacterium]|nr:MAG: hypothetical protein ACD_21C00246G0005 [uncultured bacterium]
MKENNLISLFCCFLKLGCVAFGGGYTIIALLHKETVEVRKWLNSEDLMDMMAIAQTMPGVVYVNAATMVGYRMAGFWGALVATVAGIIPTFILSLLIVVYFWEYTNHPLIAKAVNGILVGVAALIVHTIVKMWSQAVQGKSDLFVVIAAIVLLMLFHINAVIVILILGITSFIYNLLQIRRKDAVCKCCN